MTSFLQTQAEFTRHIRDPENNPFDQGIEPRRLKIYQELFFNNVMGFLSSGFPVLESLYSEENWKALGRQFFAHHDCRSPYFVDISKEFVEFLSNEYEPGEQDPDFLQELAHYEWLELAVSIRPQTQSITLWDGQSEAEAVSMSELATLVSYQYPVHQISQEFIPEQPGEPVFLVVYRNDQDEVNFSLLNPVSAHLVNSIAQYESVTMQQLEQDMCEALPHLPALTVIDGLNQTVRELLNQQILYPTAVEQSVQD